MYYVKITGNGFGVFRKGRLLREFLLLEEAMEYKKALERGDDDWCLD